MSTSNLPKSMVVSVMEPSEPGLKVMPSQSPGTASLIGPQTTGLPSPPRVRVPST